MVRRPPSILALVLALVVFLPACTQTRRATEPPEATATAEADPPAQQTQPPAPSPEIAPLSDEEASVLHRISRLYGLQAMILEAQAEGDLARAERLFDEAIRAMKALLNEQPGIHERPRFRGIYRSLLTEYQNFHGAPLDSLMKPQGEIFAFREAAFAALNLVHDPLLEDVEIRDVEPVSTVIPLTRNRLVRQSIDFLLREPERHLYHWLSRAETYFPMIEKILREVGAPDALKYLAMIESGLNPQAVSWAGAAGMWQFMPATGAAYGLQITPWVDERRDPEKATRAAARHLMDLYERFGDWHLAIAAYNCGAGNTSYALRRARQTGRETTFWGAYPYLPRETRNYVPMYIAAALVASNPTAFGVDLSEVEDGPRYSYVDVPIEGTLRLSVIADLAGTTTATIRALNPELRRSYTPPAEGAYFVRIPLGTYPQFAEGYAALPDAMKQPVTQHIVRSGDTLSEIASRYGLSVRALMRRNGLSSTVIHPGEHLVVPVPDYGGVPMAEAEPVRVVYGQRIVQPLAAVVPGRKDKDEEQTQREDRQASADANSLSVDEALRKLDGGDAQAARAEMPVRNASLTASAAEQEAATRDPRPEDPRPEDPRPDEPATRNPQPATEQPKQPEGERTTYEVRYGDTLGEIADRHDVYVSDLRRWNDLSGSTIYPGQELVMYGADEPEAPARLTHIVQSGDTLSEIADRYGVSISGLMQWNDLSGSTIRAGQRLTVYTEGAVLYRVQSGDNLVEIAREHGVSVQQLKRWNDLSGSTIYPGQELKIRS